MMQPVEKRFIETPLGIKRSYYFDHTNQTEYRRIVGGIAWPSGEAPGFIVVIAEDDNKDPRLKLRHLRLLDEYEHRSADRLVKRLYDFQNKYLVNPWYGYPNNELMSYFIDRFNRDLTKKQKGVYIAEAPFADDVHNLQLYANQVLTRTTTGRKSLHFGSKSRIPGVLSGLQPEDVKKKKSQDIPAVAAVGYALSGLDEPYVDTGYDKELYEQFISQRMAEGL